MGRDTTIKGDQIFNGALDNASVCAVLLELAQAYTGLGTPPPRTLMFSGHTMCEHGIAGAVCIGSHMQ